MNIRLDLFVADSDITETIDVPSELLKIKKDVTKIINSFGYTELENVRKSKSNSLYFTFCDEDEFNSESVTLVIGMRVADHSLKAWEDDKTRQDAVNRQKANLQKYVNAHKELNPKYDGDIPVDFIYIKYENEFYSDLDEVYDKIRHKLASFRKKHDKK